MSEHPTTELHLAPLSFHGGQGGACPLHTHFWQWGDRISDVPPPNIFNPIVHTHTHTHLFFHANDAHGSKGKEGNVLFNDALNTFYLGLYGSKGADLRVHNTGGPSH